MVVRCELVGHALGGPSLDTARGEFKPSVTVRSLTTTGSLIGHISPRTAAGHRVDMSPCLHGTSASETRVGSDGTLVGTNPRTTRWVTFKLRGKWNLHAFAGHAEPRLIARSALCSIEHEHV
jgi:hypothetical protein